MSSAPDTRFFGHPRGLATLFFTEMWERFSYYGMRAILILFMTAAVANGGMGLSAAEAGPIYAMYTSLVYLATVPGGWLADNFLGQRRSVLLGGLVIMFGHVLLALHGTGIFFAGLGCVVLGTGLLKPNISVIVGQLYGEKDTRREAGFSLFYMGINLGAFSAPLVIGWLAQNARFRTMLEGWGIDPNNAWHWGFGAAAVGMGLGVVQYLLTGKSLGEAGLRPTPKPPAVHAKNKRTLALGLTLCALLAAALLAFESSARHASQVEWESAGADAFVLRGTPEGADALEVVNGGEPLGLDGVKALVGEAKGAEFEAALKAGATRGSLAGVDIKFGGLNKGNINEGYTIALALIVVGFFANLFLTGQWTRAERARLVLIFILFCAASIFWGVFEQAGSTLNLFADRSTQNTVFGYHFDSSWWQSVNSALLVIFAPVFSWLWIALRHRNPSYATKFALGLLCAGLGFLWLVGGARGAADGSRVGIHWLLGVYLLHTIGELCLSPVGLAAMSKLAPARVTSTMMGVWFLATSVGNFMGGSVAGYYERFELPTLFLLVACSAFVMAALMFLLVKPLRRMLRDVGVGADEGAS